MGGNNLGGIGDQGGLTQPLVAILKPSETFTITRTFLNLPPAS